MEIYVGHSSNLDYREVLYRPLRNSKLDKEHSLVLPHENSEEPFNSKDYLKNECEIFIAEVSEASTGLGIELGWADLYDVPIICVHKRGSEPSSSLPEVSDTIREYSGNKELLNLIEERINENSK